jgi:methyl-accepting chemotaxis protein
MEQLAAEVVRISATVENLAKRDSEARSEANSVSCTYENAKEALRRAQTKLADAVGKLAPSRRL